MNVFMNVFMNGIAFSLTCELLDIAIRYFLQHRCCEFYLYAVLMLIRCFLQHYSREFYSYGGRLEKEDYGLVYIPFDNNEEKYLSHIPEMSQLKLAPHDADLAYGGWPYYLAIINVLP